MQEKTGIQNYLDLLKAVSEIRRMALNRSKSGTWRCKCERTGGRSKPRKWVAGQQYGRYDHGVGGGHRLNRKKQQHANQKTLSLGCEWCIFITGSNYPALLCSTEALTGVKSTFLMGQHVLRKMTRSQRNFIKIISSFAGQGKSERTGFV